MSSSDSTAQTIATGTQDLAALAGLFCTDSVETNALSMHQGYGTVVVSALSVLGLLGLVKSTIKIGLGLERCRAAGFNLESLRGIFGYSATETPARGEKVDCSSISVRFLEDEVVIMKATCILDTVKTPMTGIGSDWGGLENSGGLENTTAINIGNRRVETSISHNPVISVTFAILCSGVTAWLLILVDAPWDWVRIFATTGLHVCILLMLLLPLWLERQLGQPGRHLTPKKWDMLIGEGEVQLGHFNILHANVKRGDVLHFQGSTAFLGNVAFRAAALLVATFTVVGYLCQYTILKTASNKQAIIWISCQAALAIFRVLFWMIDPSFDDPDAIHAEYSLFNNTAFSKITPFQLFCACENGETRLPMWVYKYITGTLLREVLVQACDPAPSQHMPMQSIDITALLTIDFSRIIKRRGTDMDQLHHTWRLCLWRDTNPNQVHSTILVAVAHSHRIDDDDRTILEVPSWWMAADRNRIKRIDPNTIGIGDSCSIFAISQLGQRLHLWSNDHSDKCDDACPFEETQTQDFVPPDSWKFLDDRGSVLATLMNAAKSTGNGGACTRKPLNTWGADVWVSARAGSIDRNGKIVHQSRSALLGLSNNGIGKPLEDMLKVLKEYIQKPYQTPKRNEAKANSVEDMLKEIKEYIQKPYQTLKGNKAKVNSALSKA